MKKGLWLLSLILLFSFTFATVGGPSIIWNIYYNENTNTYRYNIENHGWRWWSMIYEYNMKTNQETIITQNNQYFFEDWVFEWNEEILQNILSQWWAQKLQELRLSELPISFELRLINFHKLDSNYETIVTDVHQYNPDKIEYFMSGYITNYIRQNRIKVNWKLQKKTIISTCRLDNINYRWFSLPWKNFVIIVASTNKSNCYEWWYISESVFPIKYINIPDSIFLNNYTEIIDYNNFDGMWPAMNQTTGGIFIKLNEEDFIKWLNKNWKEKTTEKTFKKLEKWFQIILNKIIKRFKKL